MEAGAPWRHAFQARAKFRADAPFDEELGRNGEIPPIVGSAPVEPAEPVRGRPQNFGSVREACRRRTCSCRWRGSPSEPFPGPEGRTGPTACSCLSRAFRGYRDPERDRAPTPSQPACRRVRRDAGRGRSTSARRTSRPPFRAGRHGPGGPPERNAQGGRDRYRGDAGRNRLPQERKRGGSAPRPPADRTRPSPLPRSLSPPRLQTKSCPKLQRRQVHLGRRRISAGNLGPGSTRKQSPYCRRIVRLAPSSGRFSRVDKGLWTIRRVTT